MYWDLIVLKGKYELLPLPINLIVHEILVNWKPVIFFSSWDTGSTLLSVLSRKIDMSEWSENKASKAH